MWGSGSQGRATTVAYTHENRETNGKILWQLCRASSVQLLKVTAHRATEHEQIHQHSPSLFSHRRVPMVQKMPELREIGRKETKRSERKKKCPWTISQTRREQFIMTT